MAEIETAPVLQLSVLEREIVEGILCAQVPSARVWVFGSRANGAARPFSDLDLGIDGDESLPLAKRAEIVEFFEESDLPFRVDVVDLSTVDDAFAERVRLKGLLLWPVGRHRPGIGVGD